MGEFYDALEMRDAAERDAIAFRAPAGPDPARTRSECAVLSPRASQAIEPDTVDSRAALAALPVTRKSDLLDLQAADKPFGGLNATPALGACAPLHVARTDLRSRGPARPTTGTAHARCSRRASGAVTWCSIAFPTISRPREHVRDGPAPSGLRGHSRAAWDRRNCRRARSPTCSPRATSARPSFLKLILEKCDEPDCPGRAFAARSCLGRGILPAGARSSSRHAASKRSRPMARPTSASSPTRLSARARSGA